MGVNLHKKENIGRISYIEKDSFIKVHNTHNSEIYINVEYINSFWGNDIDNTCIISLVQSNEENWVEVKESCDEIIELINMKEYNVYSKEENPLTMQEIYSMVKEAVWSLYKKEWYIIFDYVHGEDGDFVSLIDNNQDMIYLNKNDVIKFNFYRNKQESK